MKYKHIDSALHNFGHSFISYMNYVDGVYICDLLDAMARDADGAQVRLDFSASEECLPVGSAPQLVRSFRYWQTWLPKLLMSQSVNPECVGDVVLRYKLTRMGRETVIEASDDRGCQHSVLVEHPL